MFTTESSRRAFLKSAASAARSSLVVLSVPAMVTSLAHAAAAQRSGAPFTTLGAGEAAEFEAIAARIVPTDETPGATEAGVIYFIDNVLGTNRQDALGPLRQGLATLQASAASAHGGKTFRQLDPAEQDSLLKDIETTPFFNTVRYLTIAGMFSLPAYGGNRDHIGWKLLGFEDQHMWQPPFGYYDAEYLKEGR